MGYVDVELSQGEGAPVEVAEIDAVVTAKVGLYRGAMLTNECEERRQFPETPRATEAASYMVLRSSAE